MRKEIVGFDLGPEITILLEYVCQKYSYPFRSFIISRRFKSGLLGSERISNWKRKRLIVDLSFVLLLAGEKPFRYIDKKVPVSLDVRKKAENIRTEPEYLNQAYRTGLVVDIPEPEKSSKVIICEKLQSLISEKKDKETRKNNGKIKCWLKTMEKDAEIAPFVKNIKKYEEDYPMINSALKKIDKKSLVKQIEISPLDGNKLPIDQSGKSDKEEYKKDNLNKEEAEKEEKEEGKKKPSYKDLLLRGYPVLITQSGERYTLSHAANVSFEYNNKLKKYGKTRKVYNLRMEAIDKTLIGFGTELREVSLQKSMTKKEIERRKIRGEFKEIMNKEDIIEIKNRYSALEKYKEILSDEIRGFEVEECLFRSKEKDDLIKTFCGTLSEIKRCDNLNKRRELRDTVKGTKLIENEGPQNQIEVERINKLIDREKKRYKINDFRVKELKRKNKGKKSRRAKPGKHAALMQKAKLETQESKLFFSAIRKLNNKTILENSQRNKLNLRVCGKEKGNLSRCSMKCYNWIEKMIGWKNIVNVNLIEGGVDEGEIEERAFEGMKINEWIEGKISRFKRRNWKEFTEKRDV